MVVKNGVVFLMTSNGRVYSFPAKGDGQGKRISDKWNGLQKMAVD